MSTSHRSSHFFAFLLILLLVAAGGFGYWKSTLDRLPEGLNMGNGRLESTEVQIATKIPGRLAEGRVDEGRASPSPAQVSGRMRNKASTRLSPVSFRKNAARPAKQVEPDG